jgi:hypothetical protein
MVDRAAWEKAGGKTVATSDPLSNAAATTDEGTATDKVSVGTLARGKGRIVFIGALLPDPTDQYPHWFGLNGYAPTALGHHLFQKAVTWSGGADGIVAPLPPATGATALPATSHQPPVAPLLVILAGAGLAAYRMVNRRGATRAILPRRRSRRPIRRY